MATASHGGHALTLQHDGCEPGSTRLSPTSLPPAGPTLTHPDCRDQQQHSRQHDHRRERDTELIRVTDPEHDQIDSQEHLHREPILRHGLMPSAQYRQKRARRSHRDNDLSGMSSIAHHSEDRPEDCASRGRRTYAHRRPDRHARPTTSRIDQSRTGVRRRASEQRHESRIRQSRGKSFTVDQDS